MTNPGFQIVQIVTTYTPSGRVKSRIETVVSSAASMRDAFAAREAKGRTWPHRNKLVDHEVRQDGQRVPLIDLYAQEIGAEMFAAQGADENFSINLNDWFRSTLTMSMAA